MARVYLGATIRNHHSLPAMRLPASPPDFHHPGEDLAGWLRESGRRYVPRRPPELEAQKIPAPIAAPKRRRLFTQPRLIALFMLAVFAFLQYEYFDVQLRMAALRVVVAFAIPG